MKYWKNRIKEDNAALLTKSIDEIEDQLRVLYQKSYDNNQKAISDLYDDILSSSADGKIHPNDLYRFNRYVELQYRLQLELSYLAKAEIDLFTNGFEANITSARAMVDKFISDMGLHPSKPLVTPQKANDIIAQIWCSDGKHWSDRIWTNKSKLLNTMNSGLIDILSRGTSKDELIKTIKNDFSVSFASASCIVRTELTYVQNQAALNRYKELGVEKYEYLASHGSGCGVCEDMNGTTYSISSYEPGLNAPPMHPNCRCAIIPVVERGK